MGRARTTTIEVVRTVEAVKERIHNVPRRLVKNTLLRRGGAENAVHTELLVTLLVLQHPARILPHANAHNLGDGGSSKSLWDGPRPACQ